ncbi:hypothetical protein A6V39_01260 [Candidatus Mycoplasma haematobovis]|uniref:Uncharacterized protein n=1 Tax=Candidatus Mycoplasma haematobovis TaxID=432608 RepID=A0A1A9QDK6_9MOLU|nr:hypothetical protein [Candidatus Mycoplasma haematobovis]OAL10682.1 hypothetical protein A6V39_01260 [Candidatus Mycoplasma haematobovis]
MSLPIKAGIGVLTAGSIAGASYAGVSYFSKEDKQEINNTQQGTAINTLIKEEYKFKLLDTTEGAGNKDESHWTTNWETYKTDNTRANTNVLNLKGWDKSNPGDSAEALKAKCKELATEKVSDKSKDLYQNVTKYCARGVTVEEEATKKGRIILKVEASSKDESIWQSRHSKATDLKNSLDLLGITESDLTAEKIRTGCGTAKAKNKKEESSKYQEIYDAYVKVCTKQDDDPSS